MKFIKGIIEYSFYAIFLLVPLAFAGDTSELFELNKMWLTWGFALIIGAAWISRMIIEKRVVIQRTVLDIPILLFLLAHIISTMFSLDPQISFWGYYSRFNGGLLSIFTYIFLYYAFVSNLGLKETIRSIYVMMISGILVALWGIPAHFGKDPTCYVFRGTFDTSCWTNAFKPEVRLFSTLGQPAWLAAFMAALLPVTLAYFIQANNLRHIKPLRQWLLIAGYLAIVVLFYLNLIFTDTRAGIMGFWIANIIFWPLLLLDKVNFTKKILLLSVAAVFSVLAVYFLYKTNYLMFWLICIVGYSAILLFAFSRAIMRPLLISMVALWLFTALFYPRLAGLGTEMKAIFPTQTADQQVAQQPTAPAEAAPVVTTSTGETATGGGGTDSAAIRLLVWRGAVEAWKANPIFGTGVETFAFAYYKFKPAEHNLTSEWDYLYNKAHNEYLNYLTTTGLFGIGTYLAFIILFIIVIGKWFLLKNHEHESAAEHKHGLPIAPNNLLVKALFAGWISILITNFFGFSVVIMNIFLFFFPLFIFILFDKLNPHSVFSFGSDEPHHKHIDLHPFQWVAISVVVILAGIFSYQLLVYRAADVSYALGSNLNKVGSFQDAYPLLQSAADTVPSESVYKDELAINLATFATALAAQPDGKAMAAEAINKSIALSNQVTAEHPNNVVYWKNRVRIFYTLAQTDPSNQGAYLVQAANAIMKASELAPTDAKILYNLGVLYGQTGNRDKGIEILQKTISYKPDYRDAYFALGLFYHEAAIDKDGKIVNPDMQAKAITTYETILNTISPNDKEVTETLKTWKN